MKRKNQAFIFMNYTSVTKIIWYENTLLHKMKCQLIKTGERKEKIYMQFMKIIVID